MERARGTSELSPGSAYCSTRNVGNLVLFGTIPLRPVRDVLSVKRWSRTRLVPRLEDKFIAVTTSGASSWSNAKFNEAFPRYH